MTTENVYHYTMCGLDYVYLQNGFATKNIGDEVAVSIHDIDGLHKAIGLDIVNNRKQMSGPEVRFIRKELDLPQADLARLLGVAENTVRHWEKKRGAVNGAADRILRKLYLEHVDGDGSIRDLIESIANINREMHEHSIEFYESDNGWMMHAA